MSDEANNDKVNHKAIQGGPIVSGNDTIRSLSNPWENALDNPGAEIDRLYTLYSARIDPLADAIERLSAVLPVLPAAGALDESRPTSGSGNAGIGPEVRLIELAVSALREQQIALQSARLQLQRHRDALDEVLAGHDRSERLSERTIEYLRQVRAEGP